MQIVVEGKAHTGNVWTTVCPVCDSELRIIEGDPHASRLYYNCDRNQYWIRYKCPVCGELEIAQTAAFGKKANAKYEYGVRLTEKDREDMATWPEQRDDGLTMEELEFFCCTNAP